MPQARPISPFLEFLFQTGTRVKENVRLFVWQSYDVALSNAGGHVSKGRKDSDQVRGCAHMQLSAGKIESWWHSSPCFQ